MQKEIQKKLDAQIAKGNKPAPAVRIIETADAPLLSGELVDKDKRESDIVEINFRDKSAYVVEASNAPILTHKVLAEKGKPIKSVEIDFDGEKPVVHVRDGKPLSLQIAEDQLTIAHRERVDAIGAEDTPEAKDTHSKLLTEHDKAIRQLTVARMIAAPEFSYNGVGEGRPVEELKLLLFTLFEAYAIVNFPDADEIFQVTVLRGVPGEAAIMLQQGFELYPLGDPGKKMVDLSDADILKLEERTRAQRRVLTSSLIPGLNLSYNGQGNKNAFPVEDISERYLQTLFEAYRVVNIPTARRDALLRFQRLFGDRDRKGEDAEPVAANGGAVHAVGSSVS